MKIDAIKTNFIQECLRGNKRRMIEIYISNIVVGREHFLHNLKNNFYSSD